MTAHRDWDPPIARYGWNIPLPRPVIEAPCTVCGCAFDAVPDRLVRVNFLLMAWQCDHHGDDGINALLAEAIGRKQEGAS